MYLYYVYILYSFIYIGIRNSCYYNLYFCNLKMDLNLESFMKLSKELLGGMVLVFMVLGGMVGLVWRYGFSQKVWF